MGSYVPNTKEQRQEMLKEIGFQTIDDLFAHIPAEVKIQGGLNIPEGKTELEVRRDMENIAAKNQVFKTIFRGAGAYRHFIPATVKSVISKENLLTAYTPYQAEISQGILQSIFEYQTMICDLTGMDISNACVYDGAEASAEGVAMCRDRKRSKALVSATVNPYVLETIKTYCFGNEMEIEVIPEKDGLTDIEYLKEHVDAQTACVLIQHPNYYGNLEEAAEIGEITHGAGAKYVMNVNPISLGVVKTPAEYGADVAVGEGQPLGLSIAFGGPYLGFMAATQKMMRNLPGRIVGQTEDHNGKKGYVLTLQAREQHIRREKASSNICSNQALCALAVGVYLATMGNEGIKKAATLSTSKAHYLSAELAKKSHGVNDGFYPLGSCTMKYNPKINEDMAALPGFTEIHPLQPTHTVQGCLEVIKESENLLCEITGMDRMTFQPAAGAHGEFTGLLLIKAYHKSRGDEKRKKIIVPDSAHGTNPASAAMAGFQVVSIESAPDGGVDLEKLQEVCGEDTAGLMLTNPNTVGLFDKNILKITEIVHNCGGLCYYDGANLNAVMGTVRPGDMGFDVIHLNLHKTFSTPHGGGGPGSGPVGCKSMLVPFLPSYVVDGEEELKFVKEPQSIGEMKSFYGNFTVIVKALTYVKTLGREGIPEASQNAVLNANYMMNKLKDLYTMAYDEVCMHEFVMSLADLKKKTGISAMDIAKGLLDNGIHPPTMYFPLIVEEALMVEPTETESKETLDEAVEVLRKLYEIAETDAEQLHQAPVTTPVTRMDEVGAARHPYLRYEWQD